MDTNPLAIFALFAAIPIVTGLLAHRKGYRFILWVFAGGVLGLIVLAFLPFANRPDLSPDQQAASRRTGNMVGGVLSAIALGLGLLRAISANS